jgi:hypothetical protein
MHRDISPGTRTCLVWGEAVYSRMIGKVQALLVAPASNEVDQLRQRVRQLLDAITVQAGDLDHRAGALAEQAVALRLQAENLRMVLAG